MKIRNGFVSNSSSSSFIIGIAKIDDYSKLQEYFRNNNISLSYDVKIKTLSDIRSENDYDVNIRDNRIIVDSFKTDVSIPTNNFKEDDLFLIVNISNDEGDDSFTSDGWDIDYDIDLSHFDKIQGILYNSFFDTESGLNINNSVITYGAGRNG